MNVMDILRPEESPLASRAALANDIDAFRDAMRRDGFPNLDCYMNEVQSSGREVSEEDDA